MPACPRYSTAVPASSITSASPASPAPALPPPNTWRQRSRGCAGQRTCPSPSASASAPPPQAAEAARAADAVVVASALIDTLAASLDPEGRAAANSVQLVLDQVRGLAEAVRSVAK